MPLRVGGSAVKAGFYWNHRERKLVTVEGPGGVLPGTSEDRYFCVPVLAMLLPSPVIGGLFVVMLPMIGLAQALAHLGQVSWSATRRAATALATTMSPTWRPGEAYFAGKFKPEQPTGSQRYDVDPRIEGKDFDPEK